MRFSQADLLQLREKLALHLLASNDPVKRELGQRTITGTIGWRDKKQSIGDWGYDAEFKCFSIYPSFVPPLGGGVPTFHAFPRRNEDGWEIEKITVGSMYY
jgi:hypothetical protein